MIYAVAICKDLRPPGLHARDPWFPGRRPIEDQRQQPSTHVILVISRIKRLKEVQKWLVPADLSGQTLLTRGPTCRPSV